VLCAVVILASPFSSALAQAPAALGRDTRLDTLIVPGTMHQYAFRLGAGHSIEVTVMQRGVDLVVEVRNARDSVLFTVDSPNGRDGPELVQLMSPRAAQYRLHVRPYDTGEPAGRYTLDVTAWRDASATRALEAERQRARTAAADWLRARSAPLPPVAGGAPVSALAPVDALAARARVIGMGEATHGSREFGDVRLMLTRYLIEQHRFRVVAIEASVNHLAELNRYIHGGAPDSVAAILDHGWIGKRALSELIAWLSDWNRMHPADAVALVGLDPQDHSMARSALRNFIAHAYPQVVERYAMVERELAAKDSYFRNNAIDPSARQFLREFIAQATNDRPALLQLMDTALVRSGLHAARVLLQVSGFNSAQPDEWSRSRDWYMAVNLLAALQSAPQGKAVVWSHNAHIAATDDRSPASRPMGSWLRAGLGCQYGALAVSFGRGSFLALIPDDNVDRLAISTLPAAPPESIDGVLMMVHDAGTVASWGCDSGAGDLPAWLRAPQPLHWVGGLFTPGTDPREAFRPFRLVNDFDGIVFIPVVTAEAMPAPPPRVP
jgi:erythromycin esterase